MIHFYKRYKIIEFGIVYAVNENSSGRQFFKLNGKYHRETGPAIVDRNGEVYWYLNGEKIDCTTQAEFEQLMRLKAFW